MNGFKSTKARRACSAVWLVFASVLASLAMPARAASYDISGGIRFLVPDTVLLDSYSLAGPISISRQVLYDDVVPGRSWHGRAGSGADGYGLHASTYVGANNIANGDSGGLIFSAFANVLVTFTDFVITGPVGSGPVQTPINFHLAGEQILGSYTSSSPIYTSNVSSSVSLSVSAGNNAAGGGNFFYYRNGVSSPPTQTGLLVGFGSNPNVQTPLWTLPVNTPFTLQLSLYTAVQVGVVFSDGYITSALSDFGGTLRFATDRPVFGLPAGYSVNSAEAGIVNNVFTTPVPEPGSAALAALGLALVGARVRRRRIAAAAAAAALLPLLAAVPAHAAVQFTVTNLGTLGGNLSLATAINAAGQVAGSATLADGRVHATRWTNGVALNLGTLGGVNSNAYGINDVGQVVGDSLVVGSFFRKATLWSAAGTAQNLGAGFDDSRGNAINNAGTVVGFGTVSGISQALQWQPGVGFQVLSPTTASARAINAGGQVVGEVQASTPVIWQPNGAGAINLSTTTGNANGINDAGTAVGNTLQTAAIFRAGGTQLIGRLPGDSFSVANGINIRDEVVGRSSGSVSRGVLWAGGKLYDVNSLLVASSGAFVSSANAINVHGQIAGDATIGGQTRAVLLTPTGSVAWQTGGNGSFTDAARWEQGFQPSKFVDAIITGIGTQTITVGTDAATKNLSLGSTAGSPGRPTLALQNGAVLIVAGLFTVQATGTLAGDGSVAGSVVNLGTVRPGNLSVTGSFTNQGLVTGSGVFNAALVNSSTGQVRSGAGESLQVLGSAHSNAGTIEISGGGQQRYVGLLSNQADGRIQLDNATLRLDGGMTNAGQVEVGFGGATVRGNVGTTAGGKIILSGRSDTTFYNAVTVDAGGELRVSTGSTALFFGAVTQRTGALFTGTGTKFYEGGLAIGASPGLGLDAGSVNFGMGNLYTAEIGGITACTAACETNAALRDNSFDKYIVAGHLALGGTLKLVSWAGFTGQIGQSFDLFDWGSSSSGGFSNIDASGLALAPGAVLDTSQLYSAGILSITAVPEPATWALLLGGLGWIVLRRRRTDRVSPASRTTRQPSSWSTS